MVFVRLKWGLEYKGYLLSSDAYMNLQLEQCEEYLDGEAQGSLGEVLIRCATFNSWHPERTPPLPHIMTCLPLPRTSEVLHCWPRAGR